MDMFKNCYNITSMPSLLANELKEYCYCGMFEGCTSLKAINVPAKKKDYYIQRFSEEFHPLIVEMEPVKKSKKK